MKRARKRWSLRQDARMMGPEGHCTDGCLGPQSLTLSRQGAGEPLDELVTFDQAQHSINMGGVMLQLSVGSEFGTKKVCVASLAHCLGSTKVLPPVTSGVGVC